MKRTLLITLLIFLMASSVGYAGGDIQPLGIEQIDGSMDIGGLTGDITLNAATGNEVAYTLNYTVNKAAGNDTGLLVAMTDTASPGTSKILDLRVGGATKAYVVNDGTSVFTNGMTVQGFITGYGLLTSITLRLQPDINFTITDDAIEMCSGTFSGAGVTQNAVVIKPIINQSTTSSMTDLRINRTETAVGSGAQLFLDCQVATVSQMKIRNDGVIFPRQAVTASAPTYTEGGIYYDTTLHKLRVGGAAGWETITSV